MYFDEDFVGGARDRRRDRDRDRVRGARFVCFCREVAGIRDAEDRRRDDDCECRCRCGRGRVRGERDDDFGCW